MDIDDRQKQLQDKLALIRELENEIRVAENAIQERERAKKQVLLRLAPTLWQQIAQWAEDDYRSINSQIEYILSEAVKNRRKGQSQA